MANGERSRNGIYFQGDEHDYMHNHTLSPQHLMPLEEEDNDGAILMLQGAQRGECQLVKMMYNTVQLQEMSISILRKVIRGSKEGGRGLNFIKENVLGCNHNVLPFGVGIPMKK